MSEWQPIESSPKSETPIVVFIPHMRTVRTAHYARGRWVIHWSPAYKAADNQVITHWMPLPDPPKDAGQ